MDSYILTIRSKAGTECKYTCVKLLKKSENIIILFLLVFHYVTSCET